MHQLVIMHAIDQAWLECAALADSGCTAIVDRTSVPRASCYLACAHGKNTCVSYELLVENLCSWIVHGAAAEEYGQTGVQIPCAV